jgi:H+/gluconate symporter-like permease
LEWSSGPTPERASGGYRPSGLLMRLQDGVGSICALVFGTAAGSALQGLSMASGGRAFLASHKSSPAVDGDGG